MKNTVILGVLSAAFMIVACSKQPSNNSTTPPPVDKPVALSDGTNTWFVGAVRINGTNVSGTNVTIGIRTRDPSK